MRNAHKNFVGNSERKIRLGKPARKLEDNIKIVFKRRVCEVVDWIHLAQDSDQWRTRVNTVMNLRVP